MSIFSNLFGSKKEPVKEETHKEGELALCVKHLLNGDRIYVPCIYRWHIKPPYYMSLCLDRIKPTDFPFLEGYETFYDADGDAYIGTRSHEEADELAKTIQSKVAL